MNLTQIEAAYTANLNEKLSYCIANIEEAMINNYRQIESSKNFQMIEMNMNRYSNDFDSDYREDMIDQIKARYAEDWDITYVPENRKNNSHFLFYYKGQPSGYAEHIVLEEVVVQEPEPEPLVRTKMLDIRE